jgi:hypothetical protein
MWEFQSSYDGVHHRWSWKHFVHGLLSGGGGDFRSMRDAVSDAQAHGFEMHVHRWNIMPATP